MLARGGETGGAFLGDQAHGLGFQHPGERLAFRLRQLPGQPAPGLEGDVDHPRRAQAVAGGAGGVIVVGNDHHAGERVILLGAGHGPGQRSDGVRAG